MECLSEFFKLSTSAYELTFDIFSKIIIQVHKKKSGIYNIYL